MIISLLIFAASSTYFKLDKWIVIRNEEDCSAIVSYVGGTVMDILYDYGIQRTTIIITDPAFKSVDDDKRYNLQLSFVKGKKLDEGWGTISTIGFTSGDAKGISFRLKGQAAIDDVGSSEILGLKHDEVIVASLDLSESAAAMAKLKECAKAVNLTNPSDPLAGAEEKVSPPQ